MWFFPAGGAAVALALAVLSSPVRGLVCLVAFAWGARALKRDGGGLAYRHGAARLVCFGLMLAGSFGGRWGAGAGALGALVLFVWGSVDVLRGLRAGCGLRRAAGEAVFLAALLALTFGGFHYFRLFISIGRGADYSCPGAQSGAELINGDIKEPYEIFAYGDRKIVTAYAGVHLIDGAGRRVYRPEFGYAVFDFFDHARKILAGGGKGTDGAFIYDAGRDKFLFNRKIGRTDIIDTEYFNGKYYMLGENGNVVLLDDKTHAMETKDTFLLLAYAMKINGSTGKLYMASWGAGKVLKVDARTFEVEAERTLWSPAFNVEVVESMNTILVTQPLRSEVLELNGETLATVRSIPAGFGVRDIMYVPKRNMIYAANNYDGTFTETDYGSGQTLKRVYIGANARGVYRDPETEKLYAVSRCGAYEIK